MAQYFSRASTVSPKYMSSALWKWIVYSKDLLKRIVFGHLSILDKPARPEGTTSCSAMRCSSLDMCWRPFGSVEVWTLFSSIVSCHHLYIDGTNVYKTTWLCYRFYPSEEVQCQIVNKLPVGRLDFRWRNFGTNVWKQLRKQFIMISLLVWCKMIVVCCLLTFRPLWASMISWTRGSNENIMRRTRRHINPFPSN